MTPCPIYQIYGLQLATNFPFATPMQVGHGPIDLTWETTPVPLPDNPLPPLSAEPQPTTLPWPFRLASGPDYYLLRFAHVVDFYIWPHKIISHQPDPCLQDHTEIYFLGHVLAFVNELRSRLALHVSAVAIAGQAIGFLANKHAGKSSLAATLAQNGHPLLTDDLLVVCSDTDRFYAYPSYPQIRLWPDQVDHFVGDHHQFPLVLPTVSKRRIPVGPTGIGHFATEAVPLACLYLPIRQPASATADITIEPVSPQKALILLIQHTFTPHLLQSAGLQPQRLAQLAHLLTQVKVQTLTFNSGLIHLPAVAQAIVDDLAVT